MSFLSRNNFDFNKLFREGISFCTIPEEETLREQLKERQSKRADVMVSGEADTGNHILVPEKEEPLVQGIIEQIEEYLQGPAENELQLKGLNGFQRRLIYQTIETKFFQKVTAVTDQNVMLVKKMASPEDVKREEEERCVKEAADLEDQVGMTMLMKVLSDSVSEKNPSAITRTNSPSLSAQTNCGPQHLPRSLLSCAPVLPAVA